jgi:ABC-type siderophore export system fused ATPase/permease subunit
MVLAMINILCLIVMIIIIITIIMSYYNVRRDLKTMQPIIPNNDAIVNYMQGIAVPTVT